MTKPPSLHLHAPDQAAQLRAQVLLAGYTAEVREIRAMIWRLMASLEACNQVTKDALAADLALLDAAAHAAHQLALGRLEVA